MNKIDKVIQYFRNLKEEAPTMSCGNGGFSGSSSSLGPTAGFDPVIGFKKRKNGKVDNRRVHKSWRNWIDSLGM
jgi:hypothetical protein